MLLWDLDAARVDALAAASSKLVVPHPGRGAFFCNGRELGQEP